jgi:mono/diheme cytochrome c family protein
LAHHRLLTGPAAAHADGESPAVREGGRLIDGAGCRRCHRIAGAGTRLATELDRVAWQREQVALTDAIEAPNGSMPAFGLDRLQAEAIVGFLLHNSTENAAAPSYRVRFGATGGSATPFEDRCGGCHRALAPAGPLGTGSSGPNLAGLLTEYYRPTAPRGRRWSVESVPEWIENPRALRPTTTMPPVRLSTQERDALVVQMLQMSGIQSTPAHAPSSSGKSAAR